MKRYTTILLLFLSTILIGQTNIDIESLGINVIDEKGNKQGVWQLYHNDSLVMSCVYLDNKIMDTLTYYRNARILMHYIPNAEKNLWHFYSKDTISGYSKYNNDHRLLFYYVDGNQIEEELLEKISNASQFKSAYYGGASQMQKDLILDSEKEITPGIYKVSFVINENGLVTDIKVIDGPSKKMNKSIIQMVENLGRWQPAHQRGRMVKMVSTIPINIE